ncbi:MAG: signal peptidase I [Gemmatimonadetes bacterium]|nr:signal peptidase I [Gemmatimonadota bacterium]
METASEQQMRTGSRRRWWLAALLSYWLPGLGQVYNGQASRGTRFFVAAMVAAIFMAIALTREGISASAGLLFLLAFILTTIASVVEAGLAARRQPDPFPCRQYNRWYVYVVAALLSMFAFTPALKQFVHTFYIPSGAMEDSLLIGDYILADMTPDKPVAGELLIYESLEEPVRMLIKRCVAAGGQIVEIRDKVLYVDGSVVPLPPDGKHVDSVVYPADSRERDNLGPLRVPSGHLFMMGDNRDRSRDSRYTGPAPLAKIKGKAIIIYWSATPTSVLQLRGWPKPFVEVANSLWNLPSLFSRTRFGRIGMLI